MRVYKVARRLSDGKLISAVISLRVTNGSRELMQHQYKPGRVDIDNRGVGFFAFETLSQAMDFRRIHVLTGQGEIWLAETYEYAKPTYALKWSRLRDWPEGTIICRDIYLKERVL